MQAKRLLMLVEQVANASLALTGLDKAALNTPDENGRQVALDRVRQRMEAWLVAEQANVDLAADADAGVLREYVAKLAASTGFFSVWMTVFEDDADMRRRLILKFPGTDASGCFDRANGSPVTPCPNLDGLEAGGKI